VYEFQWPEVLGKLRELAAGGARVTVVYDGITPDAGTGKKNAAAIADARIKGLCIPRTTGKIMHNKFFVLSRKGKPVAVWTGSTNLTENGIFGHLNCGHIVEDDTVAAAYLDYWGELSKSPDSKTEKAWMDASNPSPPDPWDSDVTTVFSPHQGQKVLDWYAQIAGSAKVALFMTFAFGMDDRFKEVYRLDDDTLRMALMEQEGVGRTLAREKEAIKEIRARRNVLVAVGHRVLTNSFDRWLAEASPLSSNIEWVHTKFMLVDPLSDSPTIVTGSANFSQGSTSDNNENMLVIRGDRRAADIYLGEYMRCYSHHAFREAVAIAQEKGDTAWQPQHLAPDDSWQTDYYTPQHDRALRRQYFAQSA
jgi:phosphatidylserine/phosphatidylglycerophosphate/cardiolipin synthase-like enzyme